MAGKFRYPNRIVDVARLWPEMVTPKGRLVGRWEEMIALLERRDQALEDFLNTEGGGKDWSTVVVAAKNTHVGGRATADFVCDGVDDQVQIQQAVDSLPLYLDTYPRGRVVLLEGDFSLSAGIDCRGGFFVFQGQGDRNSVLPTEITAPAGSFNVFSNGNRISLQWLTVATSTTGALFTTIGQALAQECYLSLAGVVATSSAPVFLVDTVANSLGSLMSVGTLSAHRCTLSSTTDSVFSGSPSIVLSKTEIQSFASTPFALNLSYPDGSFICEITDDCYVFSPVRVTRTASSAVVGLIFAGSRFGSSTAPVTLSPQEAHSVELVDISGQGLAGSPGYGLIVNNVFGSFQSAVSSTYDQLHLRSGGVATGTDDIQIVGNTFAPLTPSGNYRCNIRVADSGCNDNVITQNSTPGGLAGGVCDFGGSTSTPTSPGAAQDSLFWMESQAAEPVAQDDTLLWMLSGVY